MAGRLIDTDERRTQARYVGVPIRLLFEGKVFTVDNWSLGGCFVEDYDGPLSKGSVFDILEVGGETGDMEAVEIKARVMRVENDGAALAVRFNSLDRHAYNVLLDSMPD